MQQTQCMQHKNRHLIYPCILAAFLALAAYFLAFIGTCCDFPSVVCVTCITKGMQWLRVVLELRVACIALDGNQPLLPYVFDNYLHVALQSYAYMIFRCWFFFICTFCQCRQWCRLVSMRCRTRNGIATLWHARMQVSSLQHLCRLAIRRLLPTDRIDRLNVPDRLQRFLCYAVHW